jgi:hypothetical protein
MLSVTSVALIWATISSLADAVPHHGHMHKHENKVEKRGTYSPDSASGTDGAFTADNWLDSFDFFTGSDPTHGYVE